MGARSFRAIDYSVFREVVGQRPGAIKSIPLPGLWMPLAEFRARNWQPVFPAIRDGIGAREPRHSHGDNLGVTVFR
jgi:hypothetical protein